MMPATSSVDMLGMRREKSRMNPTESSEPMNAARISVYDDTTPKIWMK